MVALTVEARHLTLNISFASPTSDIFKNATIGMEIYGIKPGSTIDPMTLQAAQTGWTIVPIGKASASDWPKGYGSTGGFTPVNITTQFHEVGDPNVFLAAFATAFQGGAQSLSSGITNALTPAGQATAKQTQLTNTANEQAAYAAALAASTSFNTACATYRSLAPGAKTPAATSAVDSSYYNALSAINKYDAAREIATDQLPAIPAPSPCM